MGFRDFVSRLKFWDGWDEKRMSRLVRVLGVVLGVFALLSLVGIVSYLFTWRPDKGVLSNPGMMSQDVHISGSGGKVGLLWADFLVCNCFGLGSLALVALLFFYSWKMVRNGVGDSFLRVTFSCLLGSLSLSLLFALIGSFTGLEETFGSGIGGRMGSVMFLWLRNMVGLIVTVVIILLLCLASVFTMGEGVWDSFCGLFSRKGGEEVEDSPEMETEEAEEPRESPFIIGGVVPSAPVIIEPDEPEEPEDTEESEDTAEPEDKGEPGKPQEGNLIVEMGEDLTTDVQENLPPIDPRLDDALGLPKYKFPSLDMLDDYAQNQRQVTPEELSRNNNQIRNTLENYGIHVDDIKAIVGPTVTLYKVYPSAGVRISSIKSHQDDIAVSLATKGVRIVILADSVGIEVANDRQATVPLKALLNDETFRNSKAELPVAIGCTLYNKVKVFDLADAPHLLVAGATKQGKSVGLNVLITSLLYAKHPAELKMVFIDPKMVEFSAYGNLLKHYLAVLPDSADEDDERANAIVKKAKDAEKILRSLCTEMDDRYALLSQSYVNNIKLYNEKFRARKLPPTKGHRFMPYLVVIIDEYADLIMTGGSGPEAKAASKSIMNSIIRLAQKGRAAGIHVVIATQRPSVDVVTGLIKANFPARIAFRVSTRIDSGTILDQPGAEKLIGRGDMLFYAGIEPERVQCAYISNEETNKLMDFIASQQGYHKSYNTPYYLPDPDPQAGGEGGVMVDMKDIDERFEDAARQVVMSQKGSTSDLQRKLGMGYAKAGRVMDQLEAAGIVGPQIAPGKPREVLIADLSELEPVINAFLHRS